MMTAVMFKDGIMVQINGIPTVIPVFDGDYAVSQAERKTPVPTIVGFNAKGCLYASPIC